MVWNDRYCYPKERKHIVVVDKQGNEYDHHYWNGHRYYEFIEYDDGSRDGYPSSVDIVKWRYK